MKISLRRKSFAYLGILSMLLALYSTGTIAGFISSWTITLMLLFISVALIYAGCGHIRKLPISSIIITWLLLTVLCFIGVVRGSSLIDISFYVLCLFLLLFGGAISTKAMRHSFCWLKFFGLFFAAGCYWQYLFPNRYYAILFPLFGYNAQDSIRRQFTYHNMCPGFTFQTAVTVEFIILGIVTIFYSHSQNKTRKDKVRSFFELVFLFGGLLLTGKRSPILVFPIVFVLVDLMSVKRSKKVRRLLSVILLLIVLLTILYFITPLLFKSRNSISRILEFSINSVDDLEEASNGRFALGSYAISEFLEHPVLGIGWGRYSAKYNPAGAHNIYLQLLCEGGIVGFCIAVGALYYALFYSIRMLKRQLNPPNSISAQLMKYSVFTQIYILIYGMFGNPIYDLCYVLMYFWGLWIAVVVDLSRRRLSRIQATAFN